MKRQILTALLVLLVLAFWAVLASGKASKTGKPAQVQKTEQNVEPQFPTVAPPPQPQEVFRKGTQEDLEKILKLKKGKTLAEIQAEQGQPTQSPQFNSVEEAMPNYCVVDGYDPVYWCDAPRMPTPWLACWGQVRFTTVLDIDNNHYPTIACSFPYYPFDVDTVWTRLYAWNACSLLVYGEVYGSTLTGPDCRFPYGLIGYSDTFWVQSLGASTVIKLPIKQSNCCAYGPFFAMVYILNDDDFQGRDTTDCPDAPFVGLNWILDCSEKECETYWGSPVYYPGLLFDVVSNHMSSGTIRVRAIGHTATDNACTPPVNEWQYEDSLAAAPGGVPDFDQGQFVPAFCGPTAAADVLWWQLANNTDLQMSANPVDLINEIAAASGTIPGIGTVCDALESGLLNVAKAHGGWWFAETTIYAPDFVNIQKYTREGHAMTLLLGFWQTPDGGATWYRFGGHFVAVSGVDIFAPTYQLALSDPAMDAAETGLPGLVYPHSDPWPHLGNQLVHNNPADVSKDWYPAAWPSARPSGYLYLPTYVADWSTFAGQNAGPFPNNGTYDSLLPVNVEVEQVIDLYQGVKKLRGSVQGSKAYEDNNNMGGIIEFYIVLGDKSLWPLYYGSIFSGTSRENLRGDYADYYPARSFTPSGPPIENYFTVTGKAGNYDIQMLTNKWAHVDLPGLAYNMYAFGVDGPYGVEEDIKYVIEDVYVLENKGAAEITGLEKALFMDYDIGGNSDLVDWDQQHASIWMHAAADSDIVIGLTEIPAVKGVAPITGWGILNSARVDSGQYLDSMKYWMENLGWGTDPYGTGDDMSLLLADPSFDLSPAGLHIGSYIKWGYNKSISTGGDTDWRHFLYNILHTLGYYRGDVNRDGRFDVADIVYMVSYLFKEGSNPIEFVDQGNVNNDGNTNISDVVYMVNNRFKGGPFPIDKERFYETAPIPANHKGLTNRESLFNDPAWKTLGQ